MTTPASPTQPLAGPLRIVFADPNLLPHKDQVQASLPENAEAIWHPRFDEAAVLPTLPGAHVFVGSKFTPAMGAAATELRLIHVGGAGYDGIDPAAVPRGIPVCNTFHHEDSIAEYIVTASVMVRRQLLLQDRALRLGHWASCVYEPERGQPSTLQNATVGIVGYGHIGARTAKLFKAFGASAAAVTRRPIDAAEHGLQWTGRTDALPRLLAESDIVVLCLPLTPQTRHAIGAAQLAAMKPSAILVNVSRGPLVDPDALYAALTERRIAGAVLDVWYTYPAGGSQAQPASQPFSALDNVLLSPHVSGVTRQTFQGRANDVTSNIGRLATGAPLINVLAI